MSSEITALIELLQEAYPLVIQRCHESEAGVRESLAGRMRDAMAPYEGQAERPDAMEGARFYAYNSDRDFIEVKRQTSGGVLVTAHGYFGDAMVAHPVDSTSIRIGHVSDHYIIPLEEDQ